jgi:FtsH-binding integral membrane protein
MNYKEQLLQANQSMALNMSETELHNKVETTIAKTFMRMWLSLLVAFGTAYTLAIWLLPLPFNGTLMMLSWIAWLGLIFWMSWKWQTLSYNTLAALLMVFAFLEWYGLTGVFLSYSMGSIYHVFLVSAGMFLWLAFAGYVMKIDVARVGSVLMVALIALIVAMVANFFFQNAQFDVWLSVLWLVIFAGFIIYDMNILKQQALTGDRRIELLMALWLFINFINIFLFLLRLMGNRD